MVVSAALDLAYVGCGRLDGYWESSLKPWDIAGGTLIVKEAGGEITNRFGDPWSLQDGSAVAGNPSLQRILLRRLQAIKK